MNNITKGQMLISRFTLLERLGQEGSSGQVWLAQDKEREKPVVIKILNRSTASCQEKISLIQEQCQRIGQLHHPNIARLFNFHQNHDLVFISTEYVEGEDLDTFRRGREPLPYTEAITLLLPVIDALAYAHRLGVVHRRIKAANVLIRSDNVPKLADFEIAGFSRQSVDNSFKCQLSTTTVSDDIYGLGVMMYELLTGVQPPSDYSVTPEEPYRKTPSVIKELLFNRATHVPEPLETLIARMISRLEEHCPASMEEVKHLLEQILDNSFSRQGISSFALSYQKEEPEIEQQIIRPVQLSEYTRHSYWSGLGGQNLVKTLMLILVFLALIGGGAWFLHNLSRKPAYMTKEAGQVPYAKQQAETRKTDPKKSSEQLKKHKDKQKTKETIASEPVEKSQEVKAKAKSQPVLPKTKAQPVKPKPREKVETASKPKFVRAEPGEQPVQLKKQEPTPEELSFQRFRAEGLSAFRNKEYEDAKTALQKAQVLQPGSTEVQQALSLVEDALNHNRVEERLLLARAAETKEDWEQALKAYQDALQIAPSNQPAVDGKTRSQQYLKLMQFAQFYLNKPEALHSDRNLEKVKQFLKETTAVNPKGPQLTEQIEQLDQLVQKIQIPVTLTLESDNLTEVEIYRVGKLGKFSAKELTLRPGNYTVVGWRNGYKDVRQEIRVEPGNPVQTTIIICTDKI